MCGPGISLSKSENAGETSIPSRKVPGDEYHGLFCPEGRLAQHRGSQWMSSGHYLEGLPYLHIQWWAEIQHRFLVNESPHLVRDTMSRWPSFCS